MPAPPLTKGEIRLIIATILMVLIAGGIGYWQYYINVDPVVNIPAPLSMPQPNARDLYVTALKLEVNSSAPPAGIPLQDQRLFTVDDIGDYIHGGKISPKTTNPQTPPPSLAEMQALMQKNAPVITAVHNGFRYPYQNQAGRSYSTLYPEFGKMREVARVLTADGDVKCAAGDWDGGTQRFLDAMYIGNQIPRGGPLIADLVGVALQSIGRSEAWATVDHISMQEAKRAAKRLEQIAATRVTFAQMMQEEEWGGQASLLDLFHQKDWRKQINMLASDGTGPGTGTPNWQVTLLFHSKRAMMANYTRYMDAVVANAKRPYPACVKQPALPTDPLNRAIAPVFDKAWTKYAIAVTENDLLMVSYALHAYQLEHGAYPASLKQLAPAYLKALPNDLFASGGTFRYKVTGNSYVLYSIGPDGRDNGGIASRDGQQGAAKGPGSAIMLNSKGDIVASVNVR